MSFLEDLKLVLAPDTSPPAQIEVSDHDLHIALIKAKREFMHYQREMDEHKRNPDSRLKLFDSFNGYHHYRDLLGYVEDMERFVEVGAEELGLVCWDCFELLKVRGKERARLLDEYGREGGGEGELAGEEKGYEVENEEEAVREEEEEEEGEEGGNDVETDMALAETAVKLGDLTVREN